MDELRWDLALEEGLGALEVLFVAAGYFLGVGGDGGVAVLGVRVEAFFLLLGLAAERLLCDQCHVFIVVERVLFPLPLRPCVFLPPLLRLLLLVPPTLQQFQQFLGFPRLQFHPQHWHRPQHCIC